MIRINCHWYSYDEVRAALQKKGCVIFCEEWEADRRGHTKTEWLAIKDGKTHNLESAALKEFTKKPPLV